MASSWNWAQDLIFCDFFDKVTQQFCNSCQVILCNDCAGRHKNTFKSLSHDIVPFIECQEHLGHLRPTASNATYPSAVSAWLECTGLMILHNSQKQMKVDKDPKWIKHAIIPHYKKEDSEIENTISRVNAEFHAWRKENDTHIEICIRN